VRNCRAGENPARAFSQKKEERTMRIECLLRRPTGTPVLLDKTTYHFKPSPAAARHIAEVIDADHIGTLLGIKEAYRIVPDAAAPGLKQAVAALDPDSKPATGEARVAQNSTPATKPTIPSPAGAKPPAKAAAKTKPAATTETKTGA
jgi:hypothetical protein